MKYSILIFLASIFAATLSAQDFAKGRQFSNYGIVGKTAPEFDVPFWIDAQGNTANQIFLKDYEGKFKVIYCFQSWCPGCHSRGLPALQKMSTALEGNDNAVFLAIQTVFEGHKVNTKEKLLETQNKYKLSIPFGHDAGNEATKHRSDVMNKYRTGGTPWFIIIDENNKVLYNGFEVNVDAVINYVKAME